MSAETIDATTRRPEPRAPAASLLLALTAFLLLIVAVIGWRAGLWDYPVSLIVLLPLAILASLAAVIAGLLAVLRLRRLAPGRRAMALIGLLLGAVLLALPAAKIAAGAGKPRINDISTDTDDPPAFRAVLAARAAENAATAEYGGAALAAVQKAAYPDIVPLRLARSPVVAFAAALAAAQASGFDIVATEPASGRIEATQKSFWFGFSDDVVIRIRADGAGSLVDVRSESRQGVGDSGVNAARIRVYLTRLRAAAESAGTKGG
jgi:uncharacterized protein (DUF1499 family)